MTPDSAHGVAIIGLACRFPGADTPAEFWRNLRDGVESITFFGDEELIAAGVHPSLLQHPDYVKASPILRDVDAFDASFFGYSPKEAAIMDPQHRLFLEICWEAFEDAGYDAATHHDVVVGVFAGAGSALTSYHLAHHDHPEMQGQTASLQHINNDKDFLATRVSYKLNLTGPSLTVQTACSTSLVAVHLACQSLISGECDMALAGASTVRVPHLRGYLAERGSVHSRDGRCKAFDATALGTIFGSGVAAVLLKRLSAAVDDGDHIYAVIKGSAVTNDGAGKVSYTAASAVGQARAVVEALESAQVSADTLGYVECHATGTAAGDPVEIQALTRAFRLHTRRTGFCALGSVKTNIGHPEQSAGLAGLIKTALSLTHGEIPPTLHFTTPNPGIPFAGGPFYVQSALREWPRGEAPRRAGVNSLGIGGTNAFLVLEEAPDSVEHSAHRSTNDAGDASCAQLFCLSARTEHALRNQARRFVTHLDTVGDASLADICQTVHASRTAHTFRFATTCATREELRKTLERLADGTDKRLPSPAQPRPLAFLFSGQGTQYFGMSAELYRTMARYREVLDQCDTALRPYLKTSLVEMLIEHEDGAARLTQTRFTQPALFAVEYALAELWRSWGVVPHAVMGHSIGEVVAACVAGALDFPEAIEFVVARGELMQSLAAGGAMEVFFADEATIAPVLTAVSGRVDIAALNGPRNTVVSGEREALAAARERLAAAGIGSRRLDVSEAFHSALMDPVLPELERAASCMTGRTPTIAWVSNLTAGRQQTAPSAEHWRDHARKPVRFHDGMRTLHEMGCATFVEIGPGSTAVALGRDCVPDGNVTWLASLNRQRGDARTILESLGRLYVEGHCIDWDGLIRPRRRHRVPLPTYPFERKRFWLGETRSSQPSRGDESVATIPDGASTRIDAADVSPGVDDCLYETVWQEHASGEESRRAEPGAWLIFSDGRGVGAALVNTLEMRGHVCHSVIQGQRVGSPTTRVWTVDPERRDAFDALLEGVRRCEPRPFRAAVLLWNLDTPSIGELTPAGLQHAEAIGARTMLYLSQALAATAGYETCRLWIVTRGAQSVIAAGPQTCDPGQALVWGFGRSIALEAPASWGGTIDLAIDSEFAEADAGNIADVVLDPHGEQQVAIRAPRRYVPRLRRLTDEGRRQSATPIRTDATYLITGGTGLLGLATAAWLVEDRGARNIALLSRRKPDAAAQREVDRLQAAGARVHVYTGDISIEADLRRVLAEIKAELPGLRGVVHGAGVLADRILMHMSWDLFTRATAAKVHGTRLLHDCLRDVELDFFLVQSSLLSLTGSTAQANYTAANAFLDAFVDYRRYRGLPAAAINWGPWGGAGMAAAAGSRAEEIWRARGITLISPALARRALDRVIADSLEHVVVAICDWDRYVMHVGRSAPFYSRLTTHADTGSTRRTDAADGIGSARVAERPASRAVLLEKLREHVLRELGLDHVDTRQPLQELGVDSLMSVNLANRLEAALGLKIPIAMLVRGPCLEELADTLLGDSENKSVPDAGPNGGVRGETRVATESPTGSQPARAVPHGARWLVFPRPNDAAIVRLFCFNYAGGGAAPFRAWVSLLAPSIELVVVEPPGRGSRIEEPPLVRLDRLLDGLMPEMRRYLDRPCAFFGHCLGALTLFEAARRLLREGFPDVIHLFVSGARPPNLVSASGSFEESLLGRLLADDKYDPLRPLHEQPDDTFADALRQFNIWATDDLLAQRELRTLLLPAIRADFEIAATYTHTPEPPWDVPITCFNGLDDHYVTRQQAIEWNRYTKREFRIQFRTGDHFLVVDDRDFIVATINAELAAAMHSQHARS